MTAGKVKSIEKIQKGPESSLPSRTFTRQSSVGMSPGGFESISIPQMAGNQAVQQLFRSGHTQAKLAISQPGDPDEEEADRVADQVMRMDEPGGIGSAASAIQRKCAACEAGGTTCPKCEEEGKIRRKEKPGNLPQATTAIHSQIAALRGGGQSLPPSARAFFEPRFGVDFSGVRVHTGSQAAETAKFINARAFTVGNNIAFGGGQFAPGSHEGRRLMAHELTHVIQQTNGGLSGVLSRDAAPAPTPAEAVDSKDPDKVSDVPIEAWSGASNSVRRRAVMVMLSKKIMFPWNDTTVARILNAYPDRASMEAEDIDAVKAAAARGSISGAELTGYLTLVRGFEREVGKRARENVGKNLDELDEMGKKYGIGRDAEGGASGIPSAMDKLQMAAAKVADARHYQLELTRIQVGWQPLEGSAGLLPSGKPLYFNPTEEPRDPVAGGFSMTQDDTLKQGIPPYSRVKSVFDNLDMQIGKIMSANPALYLLASTPGLDQRFAAADDRLHFGRSAMAGFDTTSPEQAKKELANAHRRATNNLRTVKTKLGEDEESNTVDVASLDALGLRVAQSAQYSTPFARWATVHSVERAKTRKEEISAFIDFATAVLLVGATIGTLGGAAAVAAVLTGGAAVGAVASAGVKFSNATDLQATGNAGIRPEDKLTSAAKVSAAELDAAIGIAIALLSAIAAAKGLKFLSVFRSSSTVVEDLARLDKLSADRAAKVVRQSVLEVGPVQTAETAGKKVEDLFRYLEPGSPEYKITLEVALKLRETGPKALAAVNFKGRPVPPTYKNWKGWHGTNVSPEELRASGGFKAPGTNTDLYEHILNKGEPSAFRGTTATPLDATARGGAGHWGKYVYEIEAGEAWDTSQIWQRNQDVFSGNHPLLGEYEVSIRGEVPWDRIKGWRVIEEGPGPAGVSRETYKLGQYVSRVEWEAAQAVKK